MSQPVWVLSVDLQAKTATFTTGLADAAKQARGSFRDIAQGAGEMGGGVEKGSLDVRHALGLVDNTIRGAHSMAMVDLIRMFQNSALVMGALPFAMTVAGFALVAGIVAEGVQKFRAMHEAIEKLTDDQTRFGTSVNESFNALKEKLLEAEKKADEFRGDHLGALHKELQLIDMQSMHELVHSFDEVAKAADTVFADLKTSWYQMGIGSAGAQHALIEFKTQYDSLLAQGKTEEAKGLLGGTLKQAQHVLELQNMAGQFVEQGGSQKDSDAKYYAIAAAHDELKSKSIGWTEKEVKAQEALIQALQAQEDITKEISKIGGAEKSGARAEEAKQAKEDAKRLEEALKAGREQYVRELIQQNKESIQTLQEGERAKIEVTEDGSKDRLAAINAAIDEEEQAGLTDSRFYAELLGERVQLTKRMADEESKLRSEAARAEAEHSQKMGELAIAAEREQAALTDSARRMTVEKQIAEEEKFADEEFRLKMKAASDEMNGLDKSGKDYENKLKALQNKEKQLITQHENEITAIKDKAEQGRNQRVLAAGQQMRDQIAQGLTQSIMGHQTWAKMVTSLGDEVASGMMQNAIKSALAENFTKEKDAASAARKAFNIGLSMGGPAGIILGPLFGAAAFASVMAFQGGTDSVPGVGRGDVVPTMLEPGEGVVPGGVMDGLRNVARSGGFDGGGQHVTVNVRPTYHVQTIDGDGMKAALEKNTIHLQRHFESTLRRMNK